MSILFVEPAYRSNTDLETREGGGGLCMARGMGEEQGEEQSFPPANSCPFTITLPEHKYSEPLKPCPGPALLALR